MITHQWAVLLKPLDLDYLLGVVWPVSWLSIAVLNLVDVIHAFHNFPKYGVIAIEPRSRDSSQEELRAACVLGRRLP